MVLFKNWLTQWSRASQTTYHVNLTVDRSDLWFNVVSFILWKRTTPPASEPPTPGASGPESPALFSHPQAAHPQIAALQARNAELEEKLRIAELALHHQVKNNLYIITSLLRMHTRQSQDAPPLERPFDSTQIAP